MYIDRDIILCDQNIFILAAGSLIAWTLFTKLLAHTIIPVSAGIERR